MDSQDPRGALSNLVVVLRKATRIVQMFPFVYLLVYAAYIIVNICSFEPFVNWIDSVCLVSPITTGFLLVASRLFRLCKWHKAACLIPTSSNIESFVDSYILQFSQYELIAIYVVLLVAVLSFLIMAHKHFFSRGR